MSCDIHFNQWVEANKITGKTIYHFGTGTHHIVGLTQAANGSDNTVFAHHGLDHRVRSLHQARD